ncbi:hypothetical protein SAMN04487982_103201 [Streptomyces sp. ok210]|nr:hypothetical protein SAMN04487982_103201 [Streptomyces sp. ok210]
MVGVTRKRNGGGKEPPLVVALGTVGGRRIQERTQRLPDLLLFRR